MAKLKKFDEKAGCRKCGSPDINSAFCDLADYTGYGHPPPAHDSERLHQHCRRCGYDWDDLPLDPSKR